MCQSQMNLKDMHNLEYKNCVYFSPLFSDWGILLYLPKQMAWDVDSSRYNVGIVIWKHLASLDFAMNHHINIEDHLFFRLQHCHRHQLTVWTVEPGHPISGDNKTGKTRDNEREMSDDFNVGIIITATAYYCVAAHMWIGTNLNSFCSDNGV